MSIIVSLDIGTSKICAVAYCTDRQLPLEYKTSKNSSFVKQLLPGYHEQSPHSIVICVHSLLRELLNSESIDPTAVSGIAVTGQMHGVLLVNPEGQPVTNLITWRDQRAAAVAAQIGPRYSEQNGCPLQIGYGGTTLAYWAQTDKDLLKADVTALSICDYISYELTGVIASEPTHAASWGIYDLTTCQWNLPMISELNIPKTILPNLKPTGKVLETILPHLAVELGIRPDVAVYSPIGDNQASVIGAQDQVSDGAILNLGTGGQVSIPQKKWCFGDGFETRPMPDGSFLLVAASICGGWTYAYLKDFFKIVIKDFTKIDMSDQDIYEKMNTSLETNSKKNSLHVNPRFCGTRENPKLHGSITNIGSDNFLPDHLIHAFAKAMIEELCDMIPSTYRRNFSTIIASGNAIRKNPAIMNVIAQSFGKSVCLAKFCEEAAVGAAIMANHNRIKSVPLHAPKP